MLPPGSTGARPPPVQNQAPSRKSGAAGTPPRQPHSFTSGLSLNQPCLLFTTPELLRVAPKQRGQRIWGPLRYFPREEESFATRQHPGGDGLPLTSLLGRKHNLMEQPLHTPTQHIQRRRLPRTPHRGLTAFTTSFGNSPRCGELGEAPAALRGRRPLREGAWKFSAHALGPKAQKELIPWKLKRATAASLAAGFQVKPILNLWVRFSTSSPANPTRARGKRPRVPGSPPASGAGAGAAPARGRSGPNEGVLQPQGQRSIRPSVCPSRLLNRNRPDLTQRVSPRIISKQLRSPSAPEAVITLITH